MKASAIQPSRCVQEIDWLVAIVLRCRLARAGGRRAAQQQKTAARNHCGEHAEGGAPHPALRGKADRRFDEQRIGDKRAQTAQIARPIEKIGIRRVPMMRAREPRLQQRRIGRDGEERKADADGEQADQPEIGIALGRRREGGRQAERQRQHSERHQGEMQCQRVNIAQPAIKGERIAVAGEQHCLEEAHRDRPHRGRAAEPGQDHLGENRLHGEQEQRGQEQRRGEDRQQDGARWCVGARH